MKKYLLLIVAALLASFAITASAQSTTLTNKEIKAIEKDAKKSAKRYEKEGYKYNGAGSLETALTRYMIATAPGSKFVESPIFIDGVKSVTIGESRAMSAAMTQFERSVRTAIKGEINTNSGGDSKEDDLEAHYEIVSSRIAGELSGDIVKHFTIYRDNPKGSGFDIIVFMTTPDLLSGNYRQKIKKMINDNIDESRKIRDYLNEPDSIK